VKLLDRVAIVTGGGSGIGRGIALELAREGARVVPVGQTSSKLDGTVALVEQDGGRARGVVCDVSDSEQVQRMIRSVVEDFGRLDILVNNAALNRTEAIPETVAELPEPWWQANLDVNLSGTFYCCKYALPALRMDGGGSIINVASTNGISAAENQAAYIASKHGMVGLTRSMALDYASQGVRVNVLCPGAFDTERLDHHARLYHDAGWKQRIAAGIPLGRLGDPRDMGRAAVFLASDDAAYITGAVVPVDGGTCARR
jgi:3-oxoacyl-[acyl-carrier protein] reductase